MSKVIKGRGRRIVLALALIVIVAVAVSAGVMAAKPNGARSAGMARDTSTLYLYSTTSMRDSNLMQKVVLPAFNAMHPEITVVPAYVGSGAALTALQKGDADVVISHLPSGGTISEASLMASNDATMRLPFAYNYFSIVGPPRDPAHVADALTMKGAFKRIAAWGKALEAAGRTRVAFVSRGDNSGTNVKELRMWRSAGVTASQTTPPTGAWYKTSGQGMGPTNIMADQLGAYTLTDTATWWNMKAQKPVPFTQIRIQLRKSAWEQNQYAIMLSNQIKHPLVNATAAEWLAMYMISKQGQLAIKNFVEFGHQLYVPNAFTISTTPMTRPTGASGPALAP